MRNFHIPFDMHAEDKIIGGYLSLRQFAWILCAGGTTVYLLAMNKGYIQGGSVNVFILAFRIVISLVVCGFAVFLAFFNVHEMSADKFLFKKLIYKMKNNIVKYTDRK